MSDLCRLAAGTSTEGRSARRVTRLDGQLENIVYQQVGRVSARVCPTKSFNRDSNGILDFKENISTIFLMDKGNGPLFRRENEFTGNFLEHLFGQVNGN